VLCSCWFASGDLSDYSFSSNARLTVDVLHASVGIGVDSDITFLLDLAPGRSITESAQIRNVVRGAK
jgi:hypothetical protein